MPCHGAWTTAPLSAHRPSSADARRLKSRHPFLPAAQQLISLFNNNNTRAAHWADHQWNAEWAENPTRLCIFRPFQEEPGSSFIRLGTGVGRFRSCLYKWGIASSAACECGAEEQIVEHVVLQCPIHRTHHGLHSLTVLDDATIEWPLNICPAAKQWLEELAQKKKKKACKCWCLMFLIWRSSCKDWVNKLPNYLLQQVIIIIIIIHAFIKRRNPTCRSKALNNDVTKVTCKANSNYVKIH